ncbi:putative deoxyribonuclease YcfH [Corynebacterium ciconiae DSM 44920]|uniref:TatD family hydrolase n=1 Tax=Corynebacterium ciconiae TaxID=227319 RepID=UPI00037F2C2A|nr:TatD family hydrolase [Corynebacterium ciconiae]WKD61632.1 putative deoxyribonuclease YcfH [Corynebacterium ciconiae DSM 44920]
MGSKKRPVPTPLAGASGLIDAHTHLTSCPDEPEAVVQRARAAGVDALVTVGDGLEEAEQALEVATQLDRVWAACAIHPTRARELDDSARERLTQLAQNPQCVSIGETGLDTYWIGKQDWCAPLEVQEEALRFHIDLAVESGKALMIHNREADADLMRVLASAPQPETVILHCFSSPLEVAQQAWERGYVLSFAGNVTFKRNDYLREAAAQVPLDQILYETDAPYMTPEPFRGARNEPAFIGHTAACIAHARGMELAEFTAAAAENFRRVYQLDT